PPAGVEAEDARSSWAPVGTANPRMTNPTTHRPIIDRLTQDVHYTHVPVSVPRADAPSAVATMAARAIMLEGRGFVSNRLSADRLPCRPRRDDLRDAGDEHRARVVVEDRAPRDPGWFEQRSTSVERA